MPKLKEKEKLITPESENNQSSEKAKKASPLRDPSTYCLIAIALLFCVYVASDIAMGISIHQKIAVTLLLLVSIYVTGIINTKSSNSEYMHKMYLCMLVCYAYFVLSSTLLDVSLGRGDLNSISSPALRREHYEQWFVNLVPFHTVKTIYIDALRNGNVTFGYVVFNALGNILLLAPLSLLIPATNKKLGAPYFLLPILLGSTIAIEVLQCAFMRGSCDIDDVIFNFLGATGFWAITKIPPVNRIMMKLMRVKL